MADALDSKSSGVTPRAGSSPAFGTNKRNGLPAHAAEAVSFYQVLPARGFTLVPAEL
jgi:hypothetical protein